MSSNHSFLYAHPSSPKSDAAQAYPVQLALVQMSYRKSSHRQQIFLLRILYNQLLIYRSNSQEFEKQSQLHQGYYEFSVAVFVNWLGYLASASKARGLVNISNNINAKAIVEAGFPINIHLLLECNC